MLEELYRESQFSAWLLCEFCCVRFSKCWLLTFCWSFSSWIHPRPQLC